MGLSRPCCRTMMYINRLIFMNQGRGNLYGSDAPRMRAARGVSQALRDLGIRELSVKAQVGSRRSLAAAGYSISSDDMHEQQTARSGARNGIRTRTAFRPGRFKLDRPVSADVRRCPLVQVSPINVRRRESAYAGEQRLKLRLRVLIFKMPSPSARTFSIMIKACHSGGLGPSPPAPAASVFAPLPSRPAPGRRRTPC